MKDAGQERLLCRASIVEPSVLGQKSSLLFQEGHRSIKLPDFSCQTPHVTEYTKVTWKSNSLAKSSFSSPCVCHSQSLHYLERILKSNSHLEFPVFCADTMRRCFPPWRGLVGRAGKHFSRSHHFKRSSRFLPGALQVPSSYCLHADTCLAAELVPRPLLCCRPASPFVQTLSPRSSFPVSMLPPPSSQRKAF